MPARDRRICALCTIYFKNAALARAILQPNSPQHLHEVIKRYVDLCVTRLSQKQLGNLNGVERGTFADLIHDQPERKRIRVAAICTQASDVDLICTR